LDRFQEPEQLLVEPIAAVVKEEVTLQIFVEPNGQHLEYTAKMKRAMRGNTSESYWA